MSGATSNRWSVLDDASRDATFELAVGIKTLTNLPKLHVLKHPQNLGYGGNQKAGYQYFIEQGFDVVVLLHGDGQYAPEMLSHLYGPIVRGEADAVFGSRMMKTYGGPLKGGMPLYKYAGNRVLTIFENKSLGLNLTEFHSGYRAYNLHALGGIHMEHMTNDFHFDTEIIIKLHHQHFRIAEVPIPTFYGDELCYVNGTRYAKDVARAVGRYLRTVRSVRPYPEFAEYFVPCPVKTSKYSNHYYARQLVGAGNRVLEINANSGALAEDLVRNGNQVMGAGDAPPEDASAYASYVQCDLERGIPAAGSEWQDGSFDRILLLDVLEHLKAPEPLLADCRRLLSERGALIVSTPNIANITVRLALLFGRFPYADRGILDWTHLRFFTRRTIRQLLEDSGFAVTGMRATVIPLERVIPLRPESFLLRSLNLLLAAVTAVMPGLFAYQIMAVCHRAK